jgi:hypothetical protein
VTSRGRRIAIIIGVLVAIAAGVMWEVGLSGAPTPAALTSGAHWRLLSHGATSGKPGDLTARRDASGLVVRLVTTGPQSNCTAPTLRSVEDRRGRAVVRIQWEGRGCADRHRGALFEMRFTTPPPTVLTFELVDSCARWDVSDPANPTRLAAPKQNDAGDCPI